MSFITIEDLSLRFGEHKVLKDISLQLEEGELITLLGPSGCGKSTLLRVIAGLEVFQEGNLFLDKEDISNILPRDRNVGMVFQNYALFPNMTIFENIAFGLALKKMPKDEIRREVMKIVRLVNLEDKIDAYPHQLSGGQQQRTSLARSLVTKPKVLLLDEPLSALDAKIRKQLQVDIKELQRTLGITMIFVTHDQEEAMILSDRIFVMSEGKIVQSATPAELYAYPKNQFVASFIGNYNILSAKDLKKIDPTFSAENAENTFAIRAESIQLAPSSGEKGIFFNGQLINYTVLGSTIRCIYDVNGIKLSVDLINNERNQESIQSQAQLYIERTNIISIEK
ncbi:ABC transporter ATP-binding protein [Oceanobacillus damuensis]|uniref:ABC transporter ATP-binding protein n=1 Tax=Oceanobacillus damuensis TaxID=937928 RepID=UPI00083622AD|nr:ABC transporter ATP-binding protein [Oceanobacillus damuensis]